jgi:hypothetical protein
MTAACVWVGTFFSFLKILVADIWSRIFSPFSWDIICEGGPTHITLMM